MTDICTTDFARINLNKLLVAIAVELVLKLVISKMKKMWLGKTFLYFLVIISN